MKKQLPISGTSSGRTDPVSWDMAKRLGLAPEEWDLINEGMGRAPNEAEFAMFFMLWSEAVSGKSSRRLTEVLDQLRPPLNLPGVGLVPVDEEYSVAFSSGERNFFSAVAPIVGSEMAISGILENLTSLGAEAVFVSSNLNLGDPEKIQTHRQLRDFIASLSRTTNTYGVPSCPLNLRFTAEYEGSPILNTFAFGLVKNKDKHIQQAPVPDSPLVYFGLPVGLDGLVLPSAGGVEGPAKLPVVDIFYQQQLNRCLLAAIEQQLFSGFIQIGEAALAGTLLQFAGRIGNGIEVQLDKLPVQFPDMSYMDLLLSRTPHRVLAVVPKENHRKLAEHFAQRGLKIFTVGRVIDSSDIELVWHHKSLGNVPFKFAIDNVLLKEHGLIPAPPMLKTRGRGFRFKSRKKKSKVDATEFDILRTEESLANIEEPRQPDYFPDLWVDMLADPNLASRHLLAQEFDREAGASSVISEVLDAPVLRMAGGSGLSCSTVSLSQYVFKDPYLAAAHALATGVRNISCAGAKLLAVSACLNAGDPNLFKDISELSEALRAIADISREWRVPVAGERVSLNNGSRAKPVPTTATISVIGRLAQAGKTCAPYFQHSAEKVLLLGKTLNELGGSEYLRYYHNSQYGLVPELNIKSELWNCNFVADLVGSGLISSAHDVSIGGVALALTEAAVAGPKVLGAKLNFSLKDDDLTERGFGSGEDFRTDFFLFSEVPGRFLISLPEANLAEVKERIAAAQIEIEAEGSTGGKVIEIGGLTQSECAVPVKTVAKIWKNGLNHMFGAIND